MAASTDTPKIFISYSWKPAQNKQKTIELAQRLSNDGIHVIIDEWDLSEGQDKYLFMEQMVNNIDIKRVLLICNQDYSEKANKKKGGVGIESLIISDDIYSKAEQTKFIPVIFEKDNEDKAFVPTFVKTRIYIDLSSEDIFEDEYEKLLRNIFDKPASKRPPIGTPPPYIESDDEVFLATAHKVKSIKNGLINDKKNTILLIQDYYDSFIASLPSFAAEESSMTPQNFDDIILNKINDLSALKDDFLNFLETYLNYSIDIDLDRLHSFFERLLNFLFNKENLDYPSNSIGYLKCDSFKFFYYELFLSFTALLIEKERFKELGFILHTPFIVHQVKHNYSKQFIFTAFKNDVSILNEHRNRKLNMNRISVTADTIKQRATGRIKWDQLQQADAILYYISLLITIPTTYNYELWYPETTCYRVQGIPIMKKAISKRFFDKLIPIFHITKKEELVEQVEKIVAKNSDNLHRFNYNIPTIKVGLNIDELCKFA